MAEKLRQLPGSALILASQAGWEKWPCGQRFSWWRIQTMGLMAREGRVEQVCEAAGVAVDSPQSRGHFK